MKKVLLIGSLFAIFSNDVASATSIYSNAEQRFEENKSKNKSGSKNKSTAKGSKTKVLDLQSANPGSTKERPTAAVIAAANAGNSYFAGTCAAYAAARIESLKMSLPPFLGDASAWATSGPQQGMIKSDYPQPGSVVVFYPGQFGASAYGHVGVVEEVREDGSWVISEMTYGVESERTFSADNANGLTFLLPADYNSSRINLKK